MYFQEKGEEASLDDSSGENSELDDSILAALEGAADVLDTMEIPFVKSLDHAIAEEFGISQFPTIVIFQVSLSANEGSPILKRKQPV